MSKVFTITDGLENMGALRTGGQGSVYKGKRSGVIYSAVKLLPTPIYSESEEDKNYRNFQNEVAKLQRVNQEPNPNVVKILSWGITESGSLPFIEMEYIDGPDLSELLQPPHEQIFTLKEAIKVADQLAGALAHCHKVGVKHGDIKSNNVKYNVHTGNYVLLDFGLAIMTEEQRRSSIRHAGAIEFMAPEQHDGHMLPQTDVYSYGMIIYELLTGQVPFPLKGSGETGRNAVMLAHLEQPIPNLLDLRRANLPQSWPDDKQMQEMQVPQWLLNVVNTCLQKDPQKRYASGVELLDAIFKGTLSMVDVPVLQQQQALAETEKQLASLIPFATEAGAKYNESKGVFELDTQMVHLSKGVFMALIGFSGLFMVLFFYAFLSGRHHPDDTLYVTAAADHHNPPAWLFMKTHVDTQVKKKPVVAKLEFKPSRMDSAYQQEKPKPIYKKKKRKKFLGIF